jgi:hypothetical protein
MTSLVTSHSSHVNSTLDKFTKERRVDNYHLCYQVFRVRAVKHDDDILRSFMDIGREYVEVSVPPHVTVENSDDTPPPEVEPAGVQHLWQTIVTQVDTGAAVTAICPTLAQRLGAELRTRSKTVRFHGFNEDSTAIGSQYTLLILEMDGYDYRNHRRAYQLLIHAQIVPGMNQPLLLGADTCAQHSIVTNTLFRMITYFTNHRDADAPARHGTITKVFLPYKRVAAPHKPIVTEYLFRPLEDDVPKDPSLGSPV